MINDQYDKIAKFYDDFVQKNRDYSQIATEFSQIIGSARNLLDIGIGTGLVVEHLLQIEPEYKVTGIDTSKDLLEQAQVRLGNKVDLYHQSVSQLDIYKQFDLAYSRGGAWTFVSNQESKVFLASHIFNTDEIKKSFQCIADCLRTGGSLMISYSNAYGDNYVEMDNGMVHKRVAKTKVIDDQLYTLLDYLFYQSDELLAEQKLKLRLIDYETCKSWLKEVGLVEKSFEIGKYYIFTKN